MKNLSVVFAGISLGALLASCGKITDTNCASYGFSQDNGHSLRVKATADTVHGLPAALSVAQSFKVSSSVSFRNMYLPLDRVGTFPKGTYTLTLTVEEDNGVASTAPGGNGNGPSGVTLSGGQATLDPAMVAAVKTSYLFNFSAPVVLNPGTTYWLRLNANYPANGTNYVEWRGYEGAHGFAHGAATQEVDTSKFSNSSVGQLQSMDFVPGC